MPALWHSFASGLDVIGGAVAGSVTARATTAREQTAQSGGPAGFVSSVCWAQGSGTLLAANSLGVIRVLELS